MTTIDILILQYQYRASLCFCTKKGEDWIRNNLTSNVIDREAVEDIEDLIKKAGLEVQVR